ncbi:DUF4055 domain-containing protein [Rhizobium sp. P32RR-XVIII]|uniref:DUF4055 domain-containing protein n=1 Tax=Rhizobium sp. P32RR-XVIII TaxID=2726738 RepID=UPI001FED95CB|nr:DUF4055 domain-containing protein [Rhizobium sp. P32RR-XVIII]
MPEAKPSDTSSDYKAMCSYWDMVSTILGGADAMRAAGVKYLPKFPNESQPDYDFRRQNSKFTNIFRDIVENLAAKPFAKEVSLSDKVSERIKKLSENITGQGDHLHVFAANCFFRGIGYAIDWILVDYTKNVPENATQADEERIGARPYWVPVTAQNLIAAYSEMIGGVETFVHVRIKEDTTERAGYGEKTIERVRVLNREVTRDERGEAISAAPATWELLEKRKGQSGEEVWTSVGSGPITIGVIPIVPFLTGRRVGHSWQVIPPLKDAAFLQVEHYQQESGLKYIKELTCFPMLAANGVTPPVGEDGKPAPVPVGPKSVLYAPPNGDGQHGEWKFIEPSAESLRFLAEDVKQTEQQLRELGRQPLTAQTGNLTVVTTAFAAQKGNSAIQAWALNLKDALENAMKLTAMWLRETEEPEVAVHDDFDLDPNDEKGPDTLIKMRAAGDLSQRTLWSEMRRRNVLSPEFDPEAEERAIIDEIPSDPSEDEQSAALA